ncbi:HipA family kinase [Lysinibacillus xylanilyticus]|uniref:HipA family kinase n=1 Tax=Lysinibacillus xylanilyticus TaxID=582475 RepID=UPI003CFDAB9E
MLNEIEASDYFKKLTIGNTTPSTTPFIAVAQSQGYVCKLYEEDLGNLHLINEYVCFHLAKLLDLPIPEASLIRITPDVISSSPDLSTRNITSTLAFGSQLVNNVQTNINPPLLDKCSNAQIIPSLVLFDQIILNRDRATNDGNLLFNTKTKELIVIDHSHVFEHGTIWDVNTLKQVENQLLVENFDKKYYRMLIRYINGYNPFASTILKISNITEEKINEIVNSIPEEWNLDSAASQALISFIMHRLNLVPHILSAMFDRCPQWKGVV